MSFPKIYDSNLRQLYYLSYSTSGAYPRCEARRAYYSLNRDLQRFPDHILVVSDLYIAPISIFHILIRIPILSYLAKLENFDAYDNRIRSYEIRYVSRSLNRSLSRVLDLNKNSISCYLIVFSKLCPSAKKDN